MTLLSPFTIVLYSFLLSHSSYLLIFLQDEVTEEECAEKVAAFLLEQEDHVQIEFSERSEGFKLKFDLKIIPKDIGGALRKSTKDMNSIFNGTKQRYKLLPNSLLKSESALKLKAMLNTLELWTDEFLEEKEDNINDYANLFYAYAEEAIDSLDENISDTKRGMFD